MPRATAYEILRSRPKVSSRVVDRAAREHGLDVRDRVLVWRIVDAEVRRRATLRALVHAFARGKPNRGVQTFLVVGFVQLFFLDAIPDHAAVGETVEAAKDVLGPKKAQYVNGVLRSALRARARGRSGDPRRDLPLRDLHLTEPLFHDPAQHPLLWAEEALNVPVALVKRWIKRYGRERAFELAQSSLTRPDVSLRIVRGDRDEVARTLLAPLSPSVPIASTSSSLDTSMLDTETDAGARGAATEDDLALDTLVPAATDDATMPLRHGNHAAILLAPARAANRIVRSALFARGDVTVQGETALRAAELVAARPGERVLDLCAAPGSKTAVLAATGAHVVATDDDERRVEHLRGTLTRLGVLERVEIVVQDGTTGFEPASFDAALVDAPSSDTGVFAARPAARWRFSTDSQRALGELQMRLLAGAAACVRPGGRLVYSTRSIEPEENQRRVRAFLAHHPEFTLDAEIESLPDPRGPSGPVDGGYAARLVRSS